MDSTSWIRYSDYEIVKDERNMDCIRPAANSVPVCYDVAAKLGRNVAELMNIVLDDKDVMGRNMKFVRRFGLLGLALEEDNYLTLPDERADMTEAVFEATGRTGDNYAGVFSRAYSEKAANISAWLDWLAVLYNRAQINRNGRMVEEPFAALTLQTMLESACKNMLASKTLKPCPVCGKVFYNEDHNAETCSDECLRVHENVKHLQWLKENLHSAPISGG